MPIPKAAKHKLTLYTVALGVTLGVSLAVHSDAQRRPPRFDALTQTELGVASEQIGRPEMFDREPAGVKDSPFGDADAPNLTPGR